MILQADENLGTQAQVQILCDTCRQQSSNPKYTPLHLAVELDLKNVITNGQLEAFLNQTDSQGNNNKSDKIFYCNFLFNLLNVRILLSSFHFRYNTINDGDQKRKCMDDQILFVKESSY